MNYAVIYLRQFGIFKAAPHTTSSSRGRLVGNANILINTHMTAASYNLQNKYFLFCLSLGQILFECVCVCVYVCVYVCACESFLCAMHSLRCALVDFVVEPNVRGCRNDISKFICPAIRFRFQDIPIIVRFGFWLSHLTQKERVHFVTATDYQSKTIHWTMIDSIQY